MYLTFSCMFSPVTVTDCPLYAAMNRRWLGFFGRCSLHLEWFTCHICHHCLSCHNSHLEWSATVLEICTITACLLQSSWMHLLKHYFPGPHSCFVLLVKCGALNTLVILFIYFFTCSVISHPGQLSLAIPSWVGTMSTSQRAVMPCDWESKGRLVRVCVTGKTMW